MKRFFRNISLLVVACIALHGCFKTTVGYTCFNLAVYEQELSDGAYTHSTDIDSYAFYVDTTLWRIASYDDAVAHRLTNKESGEVIDAPEAYGDFNSSEQYQVSLTVTEPISMLVVVNPTLRLYAYRKYELPENLAEVNAKLYMAAWRPTHSSSGWIVVNDFYAPPTEDEEQTE